MPVTAQYLESAALQEGKGIWEIFSLVQALG